MPARGTDSDRVFILCQHTNAQHTNAETGVSPGPDHSASYPRSRSIDPSVRPSC